MRGIRLWQGLQVRSGAGKGQANVHVTTGSSQANALEYDLQEIATLAIPLNLRFSIEVIRMPVRILLKAEKVSSSLLFIIFICC